MDNRKVYYNSKVPMAPFNPLNSAFHGMTGVVAEKASFHREKILRELIEENGISLEGLERELSGVPDHEDRVKVFTNFLMRKGYMLHMMVVPRSEGHAFSEEIIQIWKLAKEVRTVTSLGLATPYDPMNYSYSVTTVAEVTYDEKKRS